MAVETKGPARQTTSRHQRPSELRSAGVRDSVAPEEHSLAEANLSTANAPATGLPMSEAAKPMFDKKLVEFERGLQQVSQNAAKRRGSDTVGELDVSMASSLLMQDPGRTGARHLATLGGAFVGAAVSATLSMFLRGEFPPAGVLVVAVAMIGTYLLRPFVRRG